MTEKISVMIESDLGVMFQDSRGMYMATPGREGELPHINITADTYPAAYELAIISLHKYGARSRTHYDLKDKSGEYIHPPSIEANVSVEIRNPLKEPRMHLMVPGDFKQLELYRQEVAEGIHDSWVEPGTSKWTYTYSERLNNWNPSTDLASKDRGLLLPKGVNQLELVVEDLVRDITSKGAQATIWIPTADPMLESNRPCLQRIWFRAYDFGDKIDLNANWYFRSRDLMAWFMNDWGLTSLVEGVASELANAKDKPVNIRRIKDNSDSLHIYGKDQKMVDKYVKRMESAEGFGERVFRTNFCELFEDELTSQESFFKEETLGEREELRVNPHKGLNLDSQRNLAKRLAENYKTDPTMLTERDRNFVLNFFPEFL